MITTDSSRTSLPFIHLHLHSAYSLAEGALRMKSIPKLCHKHKMPAVAITDTGNLFGALEFAITCSDSGIQPIIGCQVQLLLPDRPPCPMVLLVQNQEGYKNLMKVVSESFVKENNALPPHITMDDLANYSAGLIALTGGHMGPLGQLILSKEQKKADEFLSDLIKIFPGRLYIELMRHGLPDQKRTEPEFLDLAFQHNIPIVATNDVFFDEPEMYEAHDALLCIAEGSYVSQGNRRKATPDHCFKSTKLMRHLFADLPEAVDNTALIAQRCYFMPTPHQPILPPFLTVSGKSEKEELREQALVGLENRLTTEVFPLHPDQTQHETIRESYFKRLHYELGIIETMGFPGYFLIVSDFIKWAKSQGIPVGPGRGSGAGSLIAWVLTITDMDPIRFNLLFERFLNPERVSMPDFDIDFCQDRRDEVIQYVCQKYGSDHVAHIITFGKLQARAVLRDVGRVLQMSYGQVDRICKLIPNNPANPVTLEQALDIEPSLKLQREQDETVDKLIDIGLKLEGLYRHASTHAAGIVIGDRPLTELVPLYRDDRSELLVTQFSMKYVEAAGLLKFDFLGLKTLTVIERCCQMVKKRDSAIDIGKIPLDDPKTFALLCDVDVVGVFQLESAGMRDVIRKLRPDRFEDLIALVALYRPGPMDDIPRYLACKHGEEEVTYLHPELQQILEPTYGVMVYQEQVMQIAQVLGGYTLGAADLLRRAMGKKIKAEMDAQRSLFTEGAVKKGVSRDIASQIFDQMAKFAGYGFNKSHSAPYALLAYQTAYLKANYPLEFFAATMTYDIHNTDKLNVYRQDLERSSIPLLPADINHSDVYFTVQNQSIRYALSGIKNVGEQAMEGVIEERPRVVNKRQLENLISAGALDSLHPNRRQIFEGTDTILAQAHLIKQERANKQTLLFGGSTQEAKIILPNLSEWNLLEKLQKEFDALGFYLSAHPLDIYRDVLETAGLTSSIDLLARAGETPTSVSLAGIILAKQERTSKKGQKFAFVTLSDTNGVFEVAFFSEAYQAVRDALVPGTAVYITASLRADNDSYRLIGQSLDSLDQKIKNRDLFLWVDETFDVPAFKAVLVDCEPGSSTIYLGVVLPNLPRMKVTLPGQYGITRDHRACFLSVRGIRAK
ncbi:MAG: DNA polymerase III subunit alpha [Alphaproteobacteria bacterium]|nr:DNA polymerase III subunit alpha [Alphaproteobacteria bacterium]